MSKHQIKYQKTAKQMNPKMFKPKQGVIKIRRLLEGLRVVK